MLRTPIVGSMRWSPPRPWVGGRSSPDDPMARLTDKDRQSVPGARATSAGGVVLRAGQRRQGAGAGSTAPGQGQRHLVAAQGDPDGDETIEQTALREVEEETGLQVRILMPVGPIEYWFVQKGTRIHKTVHYYLMEPVGGDLSLHDHEFDEVRWVSVADAETLMSFPTERDVVARALPLSDR